MTDPLAPLRLRFLARCEEDLAALQDGEPEEALKSRIHRLAGIAGIFGYDALGALANRLDDKARSDQTLSRDDLKDLEAAVAALRDGNDHAG